MKSDDAFDETITRHAILKIVQNKIIPCSCGDYREIIQDKETNTLLTQCAKCNSQSSFNIADLAIFACAFLKHAIGSNNCNELKSPKITHAEVWKLIENIKDWMKDIERQNLRSQFKVINGGLSVNRLS